ncbi:hypothetical protein COS23_01790 [bacterium (Candidatus Moisslbacteria) CG02_land_8_20_14_3_00_36_53]|nr:hypothetical protein [Candidatus Kuenenbacteria bacterium]OIP77051.1 MAG: hypothetical protein AUK09_00580 [Parcubacteria group bacterium CG2_30_36_38]PIV45943.1 MAG: hypothetical protein COS23_01790 [bacterium (Candidatus Moisslbacteria) CG02_land_8_20_14_3_00_36_53]
MAIPLYIFLCLYLVLIVVCLIFAFFNIYHIIRFGSLNFTTVFSSFLFLVGIIVTLWISYQWLSPVNWQEAARIF